ncbi:MAG: DUF2796 domain-containing protein [Wenzhouxiangella sp.]|jgi:hypothetical protein|nr:DUF2796 domain-containing protein [Wenzhouxiangella sp.]
MKKSFGVGLAFVATAMAGIPVNGQSQVERQHAAHVHGEATGTLAVDGGLVELELTLPGFNLVGFEHAPRTPEQQAALDGAVAFLSDRAWLKPRSGSDCRVLQLFAGTRGFRETVPAEDDESDHGHDHDHDHDHDDGHEHEHGHESDHAHAEADSDFDGHSDGDFDSDSGPDHHNGPEEGHAEFHVLARLDCAFPQRLEWIDLDLFERFPGNEVLLLDVLTDQLAARVRLREGDNRVELRADP